MKNEAKVGEITVGGLLLAPFVPTAVAGAALRGAAVDRGTRYILSSSRLRTISAAGLIPRVFARLRCKTLVHGCRQ